MDSGNLTLTAWGYGLTGLGYSFFALRLSRLGYLREPRELSRTSLLAAIATTALWGWFGVAFMLTGVPVLLVLSTLLDSVRYGCWFTFLGAPFLATGRTDADVEQARHSVLKQIAFYASTRSYHSVLAHHGWEDTGLELHALSVAGKWADMPALISDEMLDEWAVVATYDGLADAVRAKADGLFSTVTLTLLDEARRDVELMRDTLRRLHQD